MAPKYRKTWSSITRNTIYDLAVLHSSIVVDRNLLASLLLHGHLAPPHPVEGGLEVALAVVDTHGGDVAVGRLAVEQLHGGLQPRQVDAEHGGPAPR